jgi:hypothetical protein
MMTQMFYVNAVGAIESVAGDGSPQLYRLPPPEWRKFNDGISSQKTHTVMLYPTREEAEQAAAWWRKQKEHADCVAEWINTPRGMRWKRRCEEIAERRRIKDNEDKASDLAYKLLKLDCECCVSETRWVIEALLNHNIMQECEET